MVELRRLRDACIEALQVIANQSGSDPEVRALADQIRTIVEQQYIGNKSRGLHSVASEIRGWAREIGGSTADRVDKCLDLSGSDKRESAILDAIIRRGQIRNKREYKAALDSVERIYSDPAKQDTVRVLNELLAEFHRQQEKGE